MKTIVLGYDDTEPSRRALERAGQLVQAFDSHLIVTSVSPILVGAGRSGGPVDSADPPEHHIEELAAARAYLDTQKIKATLVVAVGEPADTIVQIAKDRGADLIVVGTREQHVMRRLFGQSVSDGISHHAPCDVLIVH